MDFRVFFQKNFFCHVPEVKQLASALFILLQANPFGVFLYGCHLKLV